MATLLVVLFLTLLQAPAPAAPVASQADHSQEAVVVEQQLTRQRFENDAVYTDFRQKHVTVPGLRPGETLEYLVIHTIHTPYAAGTSSPNTNSNATSSCSTSSSSSTFPPHARSR